jgi:hypothetical protein
VDHRVEPPTWLPQGAAREAADPGADDSPAVEDVQSAEDSGVAPAEGAPEEFSNGNGNSHDGSLTYSRDDTYAYGDDSSLAEGTSYQSPFSPHAPASTSYASEETAQAENGLPDGDAADHGGAQGAESAGHDLPASGLNDPAMPDAGFPAAATHFQSDPAGYTGTAAAPYPDSAPAYADPATPYPAHQPPPTGVAAPGPGYSGTGTGARDRRAAFGPATATVGGISAAIRAGKQKGSAKLSRGQQSKPRRRPASQARRANLVIARIEPWSVMKFSFLISQVLWIVLFVAVALLYYALSSLGVFAALQRTLASVTSSQTSSGVDLTKWTSATRVLGYTMLLGAVDVVLITAISTVGAVIYNLVTHLGGGIEVTLKETE